MSRSKFHSKGERSIGTISLPSAQSIDVKGRFKFEKIVIKQIVFERGNRGTFGEVSSVTGHLSLAHPNITLLTIDFLFLA